MDPLFVTSITVLKENLRLSNSSDLNTDLDTTIEQAIRKVRITLRQKLGQSRINILQAYTQDSPVAPDELSEYLRELAELTEIDLVKLELTYLLPMLFMDGAAGAREVFQEEGAFRKVGPADIDVLRHKLIKDTTGNIRVLCGQIPLEDRHSGNFTSLG